MAYGDPGPRQKGGRDSWGEGGGAGTCEVIEVGGGGVGKVCRRGGVTYWGNWCGKGVHSCGWRESIWGR